MNRRGGRSAAVESPHGAAVQPRGRRAALAGDLGGGGPLRRGRGRPAADVRHRLPAAERHRRAAHGPRAPARARRLARPLAADAGLQLPLPAGVRPRGHLDAERRREGAGQGRAVAPRPRPRGVRGAGLGVATALRADDHDAVPAHGRVDGLPARALHDGRRLRPRGAEVLRPPLAARLALPRLPHRQLVPVPPQLALRSRARPRRGGRRARLRPLSAGGRLGPRDDRDRAPGDDPRRRRRRRAPGGRALRRHRRQGGRSCPSSSAACR